VAEPPYFLELTRSIGDDVRATLAGELGPQPLAELVDEVFALSESLTKALDEKLPTDQRKLPVCKAGCDSCCHLHAVFVTPAEALRIAAHLRSTRSSEEIDALQKILDELAPRISEMTLRDRARERVPCPLLDASGACSVHPARPLLCRGYNSCDLDACLRAFEARQPNVRLPLNVNQASSCRSAFAGLVLGGACDGRDSGPIELILGVRAALRDPESEARWLRGEKVFDVEEALISREHAPYWREFLARELPRTRT